MTFLSALAANAQEAWNPFRQGPQRPSQAASSEPPAPPSAGLQTAPPATFRRGPVERSELPPLQVPDTSGLPPELWRGLDMKALEGILASLQLPPRSPALHQLWRRVLMSSATEPVGTLTPDHFFALRLEALYRSGLLRDMQKVLEASLATSPLIHALRARLEIGLGQREPGCRSVAALSAPNSSLPGRLKGEAQLLAGYCAAVAGNAAAAGLAAELAREEGVKAELPLAVLTGLAAGSKPRLALPSQILLLDYRFLELLGPVDAAQIYRKAEPALLAVLAGAATTDPRLRVAAAEAALRLNALAPHEVAEIYRGQSFAGFETEEAEAGSVDPGLRQALFFRAVHAAAPSSAQQDRMVRALLDEARKSKMYSQAARMVAPLIAAQQQFPEAGWSTEPYVEMLVAAGDFARARRWAEAAGLRHWLGLVSIADPERRDRGADLASLGELAYGRNLSAETLHRLVTVLDALDIDVPRPLWDAASRLPQPSTGYLPETGVLAELAQASKRREAGRTILIVIQALGPDGPDGANILALGDAIRALRRIGLDADARQIALEALLPVWPRIGT